MSHFKPSAYQQAIFDFVARGEGNGIVNAVAGSGKTSTLVEAAKLVRGKAIFVAFNKSIVEELTDRLAGTSMTVATMHSIGMRTVARALGQERKPIVEKQKYKKFVQDWMKGEGRTQFSPEDFQDVSETLRELVELVRSNLVDPRNERELEALAVHHDLQLFGFESKVLARFLNTGEQMARSQGIIDFTDMIWLPWRWSLTPYQADWVFVDEAQDLNRAQQDLVMKLVAPGGRMLIVGDRRQAIYGFAGADSRSFDRLQEMTQAQSFPLSICYRCPRSHIDLARAIVPEIEAGPTAAEGVIRRTVEENLELEVQAGDLILCRLTAPLVKVCLALIKARINAKVRGKDIGAGLGKIVRQVAKMKGYSWPDFPEYLRSWREMTVNNLERQEGGEARIQSVVDQVAAILAVHETSQARSAEDLMAEIAALFTDDRPAVMLSTVHRAKGLENPRVFIIREDKLPLTWRGQQPWEMEQELNLKYVAVTRAKRELVFVDEKPAPGAATKPIDTGEAAMASSAPAQEIFHAATACAACHPTRA